MKIIKKNDKKHNILSKIWCFVLLDELLATFDVRVLTITFEVMRFFFVTLKVTVIDRKKKIYLYWFEAQISKNVYYFFKPNSKYFPY
jgi:hypothetical protein